MKEQVFIFLVALKGVFFPLHQDRKNHGFDKGKVKVQKVGRIEHSVPESSALVKYDDSLFVTLNDGGNPSELFMIDALGEVKETRQLEQKNVDWESLTKDSSGNYYVGDFG